MQCCTTVRDYPYTSRNTAEEEFVFDEVLGWRFLKCHFEFHNEPTQHYQRHKPPFENGLFLNYKKNPADTTHSDAIRDANSRFILIHLATNKRISSRVRAKHDRREHRAAITDCVSQRLRVCDGSLSHATLPSTFSGPFYGRLRVPGHQWDIVVGYLSLDDAVKSTFATTPVTTVSQRWWPRTQLRRNKSVHAMSRSGRLQASCRTPEPSSGSSYHGLAMFADLINRK